MLEELLDRITSFRTLVTLNWAISFSQIEFLFGLVKTEFDAVWLFRHHLFTKFIDSGFGDLKGHIASISRGIYVLLLLWEMKVARVHSGCSGLMSTIEIIQGMMKLSSLFVVKIVLGYSKIRLPNF